MRSGKEGRKGVRWWGNVTDVVGSAHYSAEGGEERGKQCTFPRRNAEMEVARRKNRKRMGNEKKEKMMKQCIEGGALFMRVC